MSMYCRSPHSTCFLVVTISKISSSTFYLDNLDLYSFDFLLQHNTHMQSVHISNNYKIGCCICQKNSYLILCCHLYRFHFSYRDYYHTFGLKDCYLDESFLHFICDIHIYLYFMSTSIFLYYLCCMILSVVLHSPWPCQLLSHSFFIHDLQGIFPILVWPCLKNSLLLQYAQLYDQILAKDIFSTID